jgi:hypothetical protein
MSTIEWWQKNVKNQLKILGMCTFKYGKNVKNQAVCCLTAGKEIEASGAALPRTYFLLFQPNCWLHSTVIL